MHLPLTSSTSAAVPRSSSTKRSACTSRLPFLSFSSSFPFHPEHLGYVECIGGHGRGILGSGVVYIEFLNLLPTLWNGLRYRCLFTTSREGDIDIESGQREAGKRSDWVETNTCFRLYGRGGEEQGSEWEGFR